MIKLLMNHICEKILICITMCSLCEYLGRISLLVLFSYFEHNAQMGARLYFLLNWDSW